MESSLLSLIRDTKALLLEEEASLFSSQEEIDYFRKLHVKNRVQPTFQSIVSPPSSPQKQIETPKPVLPLPKVVEMSAPSPKVVKKEEEKDEDLRVTVKEIPIKAMRALFAKIAPELAILDDIPSDEFAKKIANRWKTKNQSAPITLLYYQEIAEHKTLLEQIVKALDVYFGPARLICAESIEKEKQWDALLSVDELKLIICCDYTLWQLKSLLQHYKEVPTQQMRRLKDKPLFLLPDLSLYLKDPLLKRSLWKGLCQTIRTLPSF